MKNKRTGGVSNADVKNSIYVVRRTMLPRVGFIPQIVFGTGRFYTDGAVCFYTSDLWKNNKTMHKINRNPNINNIK